MTDLEVLVKEVASAVEYTIQLRVTEIEMANTKSQNKRTRRNFHRSLQQVAEDIDCVRKESTKIRDKGKQALKESSIQDFSSSANDVLKVKNNMVGRDDQRERLLEDLTRGYSGEPKVIPIIGMGALGGTFDMTDEAELADMLHKSLHGKRYLIVMDDIWSSKVWDDVRRCFPSQNKGSRIMLTTRNNEVACYANTENLSLQMSSWIKMRVGTFLKV
ncbi:hypothetical protein KY285_012914 [Solanum tuberosum]|nr:hypothetical protein KY285_012914 [Solanum tuberosum]